MMSRWIGVTALAAFLAGGTLAPATAQPVTGVQDTRVMVVKPPTPRFHVALGEREIVFVSEPAAMGAEILVPACEALTAIGATDIRCIQDTQQVLFLHEGRQGVIDVRTQRMTLDGQPTPLVGPVRNIEGTIYVPSTFVSHLNPKFAVTRVRMAGFRSAPGFPQPAPIRTFTFDGQTFTYTAPTFFSGDVLMAPLEETLAAFSVTPLEWQPGDLQVFFTHQKQSALLNIRSGNAWVGQQSWVLERPVVDREDRVYVPASFIQRLEPRFNIAGL